jgi:PTH1 family peptidyl-tRNA hydrolase
LKVLVGLGNPGPEYAYTRHNIGYLVAGEVARLLGVSFAVRKFTAEIAEAAVSGERVWLVKPQTYMNCSGESVGAAIRFLKLSLDDLLVVHDDLELDPFRVQVKVGGGHGGHNGLRSINSHVGSSEYARIRVGVGRPPEFMDPADYVLGRFAKGQEHDLENCVTWAAQAATAVLEKGPAKAMNLFNRRKPE